MFQLQLFIIMYHSENCFMSSTDLLYFYTISKRTNTFYKLHLSFTESIDYIRHQTTISG